MNNLFIDRSPQEAPSRHHIHHLKIWTLCHFIDSIGLWVAPYEKWVRSMKERKNGIICNQKERLWRILVSKSSKTISFFSWGTARLCLSVSLVARHGHVSVLTNKMWGVTSVASRTGLFGPLTHDPHAFPAPRARLEMMRTILGVVVEHGGATV